MNPKLIALCISLFLSSVLLTLSFKRIPHPRSWLPYKSGYIGTLSSSAKPDVAFATFLSATTLDDESLPDEQDGYFLSTRVLAYQLLHSEGAGTNARIPFIVMCTENVSARKRARLEKDGAMVIVVEKLGADWLRPADARWADQLTKLRLFDLTEYSKICYMDADTLVTSNLDGVFLDEATLSQQTQSDQDEINNDEAPLPLTYMMSAHADFFGYDHQYPPASESDYFNAGFMVFSPSKLVFNHYTSLLKLPGRFDSGYMEQNLLNYAHRRHGNMPWKPLWHGWNVNWPTHKDYRAGAKSFHAKYWDSDPSHDPFLKAVWKEQKAEMEGFYRGRDMAGS